MKIVEKVMKEFPSPYEPFDFQRKIIEKAYKKDTSLLKMDVGTGKTIVSWYMALARSLEFGAEQILILCPPTLIRQWYNFVREFENIPSVCMYQGPPAKRAQMDLSESVVIMGYQIFLKDIRKIYAAMYKRPVFVICDEVSLRNVSSLTFKTLRLFLYDAPTAKDLNDRYNETEDPAKPFTFLTATPISNPGQIYGYIKLIHPGLYKSLADFELHHVQRKDRYNKPVAYKMVELLEDNFKFRRFDADADKLMSLPPITYIPIRYDLEPKHHALYLKMVNKEVEVFPELAARNAKDILGLFTRLQQLVTNPDMFGYNYKPAYLDMLDERLEELGEEKVIIYAHFKPTNRRILTHLGDTAAGYWSDFTQAQKNKSEDAFKNGTSRLVAHCKSGGMGLNLQHARHEIFIEIPPDPPSFKQAVGRVHRSGQTRKQFVTIFLASGTIQESIYYNLIVKDKILADVIGDKKSLRDFLLA